MFVAERARAAIAAEFPDIPPHHKVTASIGVALDARAARRHRWSASSASPTERCTRRKPKGETVPCRTFPISPADIRGLGMRIQGFEPAEYLPAHIADMPPDLAPRRARVHLPPFLKRARRHLPQIRDLRAGHDLHVFVHHDKAVRHGIPHEPVAVRSSSHQP